MKKLTRKIVALTLSLVMCISFSNTVLFPGLQAKGVRQTVG